MKIKITAVLIAALALSSCAAKAEEELPEGTSETTVSTEPEADHSLVRRWTMNQLFDSLYAGGRDFSFPIKQSEFEENGLLSDCTFSDNKIYFPDGGMLSAECGSNSDINILTAEIMTAPSDFSVYGIYLGMSYGTIRDGFGIPDFVNGEPDRESGTTVFIGAGTQQFTIEFKDGKAVKFIFSQD